MCIDIHLSIHKVKELPFDRIRVTEQKGLSLKALPQCLRSQGLAFTPQDLYSRPMKIHIDPELCTGCEDCTEACPSLFKMGSDWIAEPAKNPVPADKEDDAVKTADLCQFEAIRIENN